MKKLLEFKNVDLCYQTIDDEIKALDNVNFEIMDKEFVAIVGPSGCGKTTILSLIAGLFPVSSGEILLDGKNLNEIESNIGYMFQSDQLFKWRTIWKNIMIGLEIQKKDKDPENIRRMTELLSKYGLADFKNKHPNELSGGMRQRVALLRTLALNPKILLLDEPFSALDFQTRIDVCDDVSSIIEKEEKTALLVTHDISEAISMADKIIVLTKRPATVKKIFDIKLKHYGAPVKRREAPEFAVLFDKILKELNS